MSGKRKIKSPYKNHLNSYESLITPYEEIRAGFISIALEKNRYATPFVEEAKVLRVIASKVKKPGDLLDISHIHNSLLTAAGVSDKARKYLEKKDRKVAIKKLIENFLNPSGNSFVDELVYRFLLTKGGSLGGIIRNLAGKIGEWRFTRIFISTLSINEKNFRYIKSKDSEWLKPKSKVGLERNIKGLTWKTNKKDRILIYNLNVPNIKKNVDLCLLDSSPKKLHFNKSKQSAHNNLDKYLALGELKGGIDPAGADEHWKTANSSLGRVRNAFSQQKLTPDTFFIGAAIELAMSKEIYHQLEEGILQNSANLTNERQVISLCNWLINL